MKGYYFITDSCLSEKGNLADVKEAVSAGVQVIQYRQKNAAAKQMYNEALSLKNICQGRLFLINDRVDVALAVDADGVHLGQSDLPCEAARKILGKEKIIGLTVSSIEQACQAQAKGADYIGVSPIFSTQTKTDAGNALGIELLKQIRENVSMPIVVIGGITLENAKDVIAAGADAICAISAVLGKADIKEEINKFQNLFSTHTL